jgi:HSP20 family protein
MFNHKNVYDMSLLIKHEPFSRFFDDFFPSFSNGGVVSKTTSPLVNVKETDKAYTLELAVPGLKRDDISISVEDNLLTISYENKKENEERTEQFHRREFVCTSFERSFRLPENEVNIDKLEANYQDGVLNIHIPKHKESENRKRRLISIK